MIGVALGILKWIGILLGAVLGVLLLLCLLVLFSRLRYEAHVDKNAKWRVNVTAKWLLSILRVDFRKADDKQRMRIRFFGRTLGRNPKRDADDSPEHPSPSEDEAAEDVANNVKQALKKAAAEVVEETVDQAEEQSHTTSKARTKPKADKPVNASGKSEGKDKADFAQEGGLAGLRRQVRLFWDYPDKALIWKYTKQLVVRLIHVLRPKRFILRGVIGFDSPDITGKVIGGICIFQGLSGWDIRLRGNFEEEEITVRGMMAGKVTLWSLLWPIVRYALRKPIWKIVKPILFKGKKKGSR